MNLLKLIVPEQKRWERIYDLFNSEFNRPYLICNEDGLRRFAHEIKAWTECCHEFTIPDDLLEAIIKDQININAVLIGFRRDGFLWRLLRSVKDA